MMSPMMSRVSRLARKYVPQALRERVRDLRGPGPVVKDQRSTTALVADVRERIAGGDLAGATAMAVELGKDSSTRELGDLCFALVCFHRGCTELAWHKFAPLPRALWSQFAASAYVRAGIDHDLETVLREVKELVDGPASQMNPRRWMDVLEPVFGTGETDLARKIFVALDAAIARQPQVSTKVLARRDWIRRWMDRSPDSPTASKPSADVSFAVMDYDHPSRFKASGNIGDHVQSLASLGHLVRHQDLDYQGPPELVDLLTRLSARVRPDARRTGLAASVQVMTVDRDATTYNEVPEGTWAMAFGWYMHALSGARFVFPFHRNLQPVFISFHCSNPRLLNPEAIEYLRAHGPIGCRDWTTVDILLSVDVPAFFSGCLTTTVSTVFPHLAEAFPSSAPVAYVDSSGAPPGAATYEQAYDAVRFRSFTDNVLEAVDLLENYRRNHSAIVTSRLHCYLPMRSLGAQVDFRPRNRSDSRFAGLIDLTDDEFDAIRDGIDDRLENLFGAILAGGSPEDVYSLWRELCADDVALARKRHAAPPAAREQSTDVDDRIRRAVLGSRTVGPMAVTGAIDVAIRVGERRSQPLDVLVESLVSRASRPLHLWLLDGSDDGVDLDEVVRHAGGSTVTAIPANALDALALPGLLPDVDRVVVLPRAALVQRDVAELTDLDLAGHALAAPDTVGGTASSGFGVIHAAALRQATRTAVATELRRRAHAQHAFDFRAFDIAVLVLDLERLRQEALVREAAQLAEEFGLSAREVLHFHAGPARATVPSAWHVVPTRNHADAPALLHWVDEPKPWTSDSAPAQELWLEQQRRLEHS